MKNPRKTKRFNEVPASEQAAREAKAAAASKERFDFKTGQLAKRGK